MTTETTPQEPIPANPEHAEPNQANPPEFDIDTALDAHVQEQFKEEAPQPEPTATPQAEPETDGQDTLPAAESAPQPEPAKKWKLKVDGQEIEADEAQVIAMAQMGHDYRRKTMELAEMRRILLQNAGHNQPQQQQQQAPESDDPVEMLKREIEQDIVQRIQPQFARSQQEQAIQMTMAQVRNDELYDDVQNALKESIKALPEFLQRDAYTRLDSDPSVYLAEYGRHRARILSERSAASPAPTGAAPQDAAGVVETRAERSPVLEAGGSTTPPPQNAAKTKKIEAARARLKRGEGGESDIDLLLDLHTAQALA